MRQSVSKTFSWVQMSVIQHVLMEEMELQSVRSYFRSLQKVSQVKVLFTVSYINVELLKSWMDTNLS